jgi:hypothetical protein
MPIATAVSYFGRCKGGDFAFYPEGAEGEPQTIPARHNTAVLLDTDSVFHGVDRVSDEPVAMAPLSPGMQLLWESGGSWRVGPEAEPIVRYPADEVRFSVSWKAYCYTDEAEERAAREHSDDIGREQALETLFADLRERGRLGDELPERRDLAMLMVDEYVKFPRPARLAEQP